MIPTLNRILEVVGLDQQSKYKNIVHTMINSGGHEIFNLILSENEQLQVEEALSFFKKFQELDEDPEQELKVIFRNKNPSVKEYRRLEVAKNVFILDVVWGKYYLYFGYDGRYNDLHDFTVSQGHNINSYPWMKEHGLHFDSEYDMNPRMYDYGVPTEELHKGEKIRIKNLIRRYQTNTFNHTECIVDVYVSIRIYLLSKKYYYKWINLASKPPNGRLYHFDHILFFSGKLES